MTRTKCWRNMQEMTRGGSTFQLASGDPPYTPRADFQGGSDDAVLRSVSPRLGIEPTRP
jgi:hypothetical protein